MTTPELKTTEQIVKEFTQLGEEKAHVVQVTRAQEFQSKALSSGYDPQFASILAKAIAATWDADETIEALNEFMKETVEEDIEKDNEKGEKYK